MVCSVGSNNQDIGSRGRFVTVSVPNIDQVYKINVYLSVSSGHSSEEFVWLS